MQPLDTTTRVVIDDSDLDVTEIVRETLADVTPRAAALALLRFADYLALIQQAGVPPSERLTAALYEELRSICLRDS